MEREIKFKLIKKGKVVGYEIMYNQFNPGNMDKELFYMHKDLDDNLEGWISHDDKVQYTGFKDTKTNEELYHNDIVKVLEYYSGDYLHKETIGVGEWIDDGWAIVDKECEYICGLWDYVYNNCGGKVGDVYNNPELIKNLK